MTLKRTILLWILILGRTLAARAVRLSVTVHCTCSCARDIHRSPRVSDAGGAAAGGFDFDVDLATAVRPRDAYCRRAHTRTRTVQAPAVTEDADFSFNFDVGSAGASSAAQSAPLAAGSSAPAVQVCVYACRTRITTRSRHC